MAYELVKNSKKLYNKVKEELEKLGEEFFIAETLPEKSLLRIFNQNYFDLEGKFAKEYDILKIDKNKFSLVAIANQSFVEDIMGGYA